VQAYVDDVVTVTEDEIREAVRQVVTGARLVAEPGGAVAAGAGLVHAWPSVRRAVAVVSGGNVDPAWLSEVLRP